jgi:hypothetical protein
MGRSFESVRMGVKEVSARWAKAGRALKKDDQIYATKLSDMAKKHSSEAFYAMDDPLEAAVFSVLVEMIKEMEENNSGYTDLLQAPGASDGQNQNGSVKRSSKHSD